MNDILQPKGRWPWEKLFWRSPREALEECSSDPSPSPPRSYRFSRDHRLHTLPLCENCDALTRECLTQAKAYNLLKNCFDLIETSKRCRLCAFIAQTMLYREGQRLRDRISGYGVTADMNWPLSLAMRHGFLEVFLGNSDSCGPMTELREYSESSTVLCDLFNAPDSLRLAQIPSLMECVYLGFRSTAASVQSPAAHPRVSCSN